jgi:hypothetical protein
MGIERSAIEKRWTNTNFAQSQSTCVNLSLHSTILLIFNFYTLRFLIPSFILFLYLIYNLSFFLKN